MSPLNFPGAVLVLCLLLVPAHRVSLTAQQVPSRAAFEHLRDSLSTQSDTAALRTQLRSARRYEQKNRGNASSALRSGLLALRLGELKADADFGEARTRFREAAHREPARPEPWFGLGVAEASRSQWEMSESLNLGSRVGLKALERAANSYRRALASDATYLPAALALAQVELALMDTARLVLARDALRQSAKTMAPAPTELLLALGRVERAAGSLDSACIAFERHLLTGPNRALALLELARTRLALGRSDGDAAYYEGAAMDDPEAVAGYRADLRLLAPDSAVREFDRLKGQSRAAYLHRFWTGRDYLELRAEGERLREHYRRIQFARVHFPLTISRRFYGRLDAYRSGSLELDDRGVIYVRHGEPSQRLRPFVFGAMPNESWQYSRAEGDLLLHFSAGWDHNGGGDLYDYRLVQSVLDLRGAADAPQDQLLLSRQKLSPTYARMLNWGRYGAARARTQERSVGVASIAASTTSDSYELQFRRRLGVVADLIAVGQSPGGSLAHLVFGIMADGLTPEMRDGEASYRVRVRLVTLDESDHAVARLDTVFVITRSEPLRTGEFLVGRAELPLPAGRWTYRASIAQGDSAGVVLPRRSVEAVATDGRHLSLSDIALGSRGRAVSWVTDAADTVLLAPSALFRKGMDMQLYYEVSGAAPGARYRHEISILEEGAKSRRVVGLSFEEDALAEVIRSRRVVRLDRLNEGRYIVEVNVRAPDGSAQVRRRSIQIIGR